MINQRGGVMKSKGGGGVDRSKGGGGVVRSKGGEIGRASCRERV